MEWKSFYSYIHLMMIQKEAKTWKEMSWVFQRKVLIDGKNVIVIYYDMW